MMESQQLKPIQMTSVTLAMEGRSMERAMSGGPTGGEVSITTAAHPNDELEWHHRFKVVKVYGEPYRRGRFLCYEYDLNDATRQQNEPKIEELPQQNAKEEKSEPKKGSEEEVQSAKKETKEEPGFQKIPQEAPQDVQSNQEDGDRCLCDDNNQTNVEVEQQNEVAIDNKIEQAMDLVKSHLMFAVREEVDVLKERITELQERIGTLEAENATLRQYIINNFDENTLNLVLNKQVNNTVQSQTPS